MNLLSIYSNKVYSISYKNIKIDPVNKILFQPKTCRQKKTIFGYIDDFFFLGKAERETRLKLKFLVKKEQSGKRKLKI